MINYACKLRDRGCQELSELREREPRLGFGREALPLKARLVSSALRIWPVCSLVESLKVQWLDNPENYTRTDDKVMRTAQARPVMGLSKCHYYPIPM